MRKSFIITTFIVFSCGSAAAYLSYDWHKKTRIKEEDKYVSVYSWVDPAGNTHISDKAPPAGFTITEEEKWEKYLEPPVILQIKNGIVSSYHGAKALISSYFEDGDEPRRQPETAKTEDGKATSLARSQPSQPKPNRSGKKIKKKKGKT